MNYLRRRFPLAAATAVPLLACDQAESAGSRLLRQIGQPDNNTAAFALGSGGYRDYRLDGFFVLGRPEAKHAWP